MKTVLQVQTGNSVFKTLKFIFQFIRLFHRIPCDALPQRTNLIRFRLYHTMESTPKFYTGREIRESCTRG